MKKIFLYFLLLLGLVIIVFSILYGKKGIDVEELKLKYGTSPSLFLEMNEMEVHYRDEGNGNDSLPLVLLHGTGASLHTFNDWVEGLKDEKRIIRMDLPAFGLTGPFPDRNYAMKHYVDFLDDFLSDLNIERCILGGNSLGGQIAWLYTLDYPDKVDQLVLIDAAGYPKQSTKVPLAFKLARIPVLNKILTFITPKSVVKSSVENVYADQTKITDTLINRYFDLALREGNRQALVDRMTTEYDTSQIVNISKIFQPTLIMWGREDGLIPLESAYRFQNDLLNDTLIVIDHCGHVPQEECPEKSLAVLKEFLNI